MRVTICQIYANSPLVPTSLDSCRKWQEMESVRGRSGEFRDDHELLELETECDDVFSERG